MLEYDRIDISEGIDINKCEETSRECSLCKFYYFLDKKDASNLIKNAVTLGEKGTLQNNLLFVYNIKK